MMIKKMLVASILLGLLGLFQLSACTTRYYVLSDKTTTPHLQGTSAFVASDAVALPLTVWQPAKPAKANIILLHGFNEYSGAFERVGKQFAALGMRVWAYDQRGFGRNKQRGLWAGAKRMAQDTQEFAQVLRQQDRQQPLYLLGMSMGGAVSLVAASQAQLLPVDGLILVAPAVWARRTQPFYQRWALNVARIVAPGWRPTGKGLKRQATDNSEMLREIWRSPYMIRETRIDTLDGLVTLMDKAYEAAPMIEYPTLLLYGEKDQIVPKRPIEDLWRRLPKVAGSDYRLYDNGWHMLMRDLQGARVIQDIAQWIQR